MQQVEIVLSGTNFASLDPTSKCDPMVALFVEGQDGKLVEFGRTEMIRNTEAPSFVRSFVVDTKPEGQRQLRFVVFHVDDEKGVLRVSNLLGEVDCYLEKVLEQPHGVLSCKVTNRKLGKEMGTLNVRATPISPEAKGEASFRLEGKKIVGRSRWTKPACILSVARTNEVGIPTPLRETSKPENRTVNPAFPTVTLPLRKLSPSGDMDRGLVFSVYEVVHGRDPVLLGSHATTLTTLRNTPVGSALPLTLHSPQAAKKVNLGDLVLADFSFRKDETASSLSPKVEQPQQNDPKRVAILNAILAIRSDEAEKQKSGARELTNTTHNDTEAQDAVRSMDGIQALVSLLESSDDSVVLESLYSLKNLACNDENRFVLADVGGLTAAASHLSSDNKQVATQSFWLLSNATHNNQQNRSDLGSKPDVVAAAVTAVKSDDAALAEQAAVFLGGLAFGNADNKQAIVDADGAAALVTALSSDTPAVTEASAFALKNLATSKELCAAISATEPWQALVALLSSPSDKTQLQAAWTLANLVDAENGEDGAKALAGVEGAKEALGKLETEPAKTHAGAALQAIENSA